jgi:hypothetical protein
MSFETAERRSLVYKLLTASIAKVDQSLANVQKKDDAQTAKALEAYSKCLEKPDSDALKCQEVLRQESIRLRKYEKIVEHQTLKAYTCLNSEFTKEIKAETDFAKGVQKCLDDFEKTTIAVLTSQANSVSK